jgi:hypothetical protein
VSVRVIGGWLVLLAAPEEAELWEDEFRDTMNALYPIHPNAHKNKRGNKKRTLFILSAWRIYLRVCSEILGRYCHLLSWLEKDLLRYI